MLASSKFGKVPTSKGGGEEVGLKWRKLKFAKFFLFTINCQIVLRKIETSLFECKFSPIKTVSSRLQKWNKTTFSSWLLFECQIQQKIHLTISNNFCSDCDCDCEIFSINYVSFLIVGLAWTKANGQRQQTPFPNCRWGSPAIYWRVF